MKTRIGSMMIFDYTISKRHIGLYKYTNIFPFIISGGGENTVNLNNTFHVAGKTKPPTRAETARLLGFSA